MGGVCDFERGITFPASAKEIKSTTHKLLDLLHLIFMDLKSSEEKTKILHEDYNIEFSSDMEEELKKMGGLMQPLLDIAAEKAAEKAAFEATVETERKSRLEDIRSLMETTRWTAKQAMDALKIPAEKQAEFFSLI